MLRRLFSVNKRYSLIQLPISLVISMMLTIPPPPSNIFSIHYVNNYSILVFNSIMISLSLVNLLLAFLFQTTLPFVNSFSKKRMILHSLDTLVFTKCSNTFLNVSLVPASDMMFWIMFVLVLRVKSQNLVILALLVL